MTDLLKSILSDKKLKRNRGSYSTEQTFSNMFKGKNKNENKQGNINPKFKKMANRVNTELGHPKSFLNTGDESDNWGSVHIEPSVLHKLDVIAKDNKIPNDLLANEIIKRCIK